MITITDLKFSFSNNQPLLSGVNLVLKPGSVVGLIGPSGGGKSTLLKLIGGLLCSTQGHLTCRTCQHGFMFQEGALFDSLSVLDNVAFPLVEGRVPVTTLPHDLRKEVVEKSVWILERVGLKKAVSKFPAQLSGGMRRRASLARALVTNPGLALLDDPTSGLDPVASRIIMDLVRELHDEATSCKELSFRTTLVVSHDLRRLFPMVDEVVALFDGKIVFQGSVDELVKTTDERLRHFVQCRYEIAS